MYDWTMSIPRSITSEGCQTGCACCVCLSAPDGVSTSLHSYGAPRICRLRTRRVSCQSSKFEQPNFCYHKPFAHGSLAHSARACGQHKECSKTYSAHPHGGSMWQLLAVSHLAALLELFLSLGHINANQNWDERQAPCHQGGRVTSRLISQHHFNQGF